jgi:outer membrane protein OmpA-like peptidoglycan-associated protein
MFKNATPILIIAVIITLSGCLKEWRTTKSQTHTPTQEQVDALGTAIATNAEQFYSIYDENLGEFTKHEQMPSRAHEPETAALEFTPICFGYDSCVITADQEEILQRNIAHCKECLQRSPEQKLVIVIEGHACNAAGKSDYNKKLSEKRAHAVREKLLQAGIPAEAVRIAACGSDKTIVQGDRLAQAPNRRCEMRIMQA